MYPTASATEGKGRSIKTLDSNECLRPGSCDGRLETKESFLFGLQQETILPCAMDDTPNLNHIFFDNIKYAGEGI